MKTTVSTHGFGSAVVDTEIRIKTHQIHTFSPASVSQAQLAYCFWHLAPAGATALQLGCNLAHLELEHFAYRSRKIFACRLDMEGWDGREESFQIRMICRKNLQKVRGMTGHLDKSICHLAKKCYGAIWQKGHLHCSSVVASRH